MVYEVPILFCIFNRPEVTAQVFAAIRQQRPRRLLVVADGPRADRPAEHQLVQQTRNLVTSIDWDCQLETCFSETNLGCRARMTSGLNWAFQRAEELVILEDDCLPHPKFFEFCRVLLERYRNEDRIKMISGDQFNSQLNLESSYYFSRWTHIWGWASWRRAWQFNDVHISDWPERKQANEMRFWCDSLAEQHHWTPIFDAVHRGEIDTWDFSWMYSCWRHQGLTILPRTNLVTNLGFGQSATHTVDADSPLARLATQDFGQWRHPTQVDRNEAADRWTFENIFLPSMAQSDRVQPPRPHWLQRWRRKLNRLWQGSRL